MAGSCWTFRTRSEMQTPSSPQSLWKGIYKKKKRKTIPEICYWVKQANCRRTHNSIIPFIWSSKPCETKPYFRNIYVFSNIRKKNIDKCKIQDGGAIWGRKIKVDMIEYGVIQRISEVPVPFYFFLNGSWTQGVPFIVIYFFNKHLLSACSGLSTTHGAGNRAENKEDKVPIFMEFTCWWTFHRSNCTSIRKLPT